MLEVFSIRSKSELFYDDTFSEIPCKGLGMKVEVYGPMGENIEHTGQAGEMVCTRPHPSIPLYFWGDTSGERFRRTYYDTYPGERFCHSCDTDLMYECEGVWRQGDFMVVNPATNGMMVLGRRLNILYPRSEGDGTEFDCAVTVS